MNRRMRTHPKDGASRWENLHSQPHVPQRAFNNHEVLTQGWYPVCAAKELKKEQVKSFKFLQQRIVVFRTIKNTLHALDAFCPHLGADLGNGKVVGNNLQCYFHQWELASNGSLAKIPCKKHLEEGFQKIQNQAYPVTEAYGHIWVFSAPEATHPMPVPSGLEDRDMASVMVKEIRLFAHHHVLMANGIDLQHFSAVHKLDIDFDFKVSDRSDGVFEWALSGQIPTNNLKGKIGRFFLGPKFEYKVKFSGGSVVSITYGTDQKFMGFKLPSLQILWGCLPQPEGVSNVRIFFVSPRYRGVFGPLKIAGIYFLTLLTLTVLRDEDIYAFPNMRFNAHQLIKEDRSLGRLIQLINQLKLSKWGKTEAEL